MAVRRLRPWGVRAAAMHTLIGIATLNHVDPQAWLVDVLARSAETPQTRLDELLPWSRNAARQPDSAAWTAIIGFALPIPPSWSQ